MADEPGEDGGSGAVVTDEQGGVKLSDPGGASETSSAPGVDSDGVDVLGGTNADTDLAEGEPLPSDEEEPAGVASAAIPPAPEIIPVSERPAVEHNWPTPEKVKGKEVPKQTTAPTPRQSETSLETHVSVDPGVPALSGPGAFAMPGIAAAGPSADGERLRNTAAASPLEVPPPDYPITAIAHVVSSQRDMGPISPIAVATRDKCVFNLRDRRVQIGLLVAVVALMGLALGLGMSLADDDGADSLEGEPPIVSPTSAPTSMPSFFPTISPYPTWLPSVVPSINPTARPTHVPSFVPSQTHSDAPSHNPSNAPSVEPTSDPSSLPSPLPSEPPSTRFAPSESPSSSSIPSASPTSLFWEQLGLDLDGQVPYKQFGRALSLSPDGQVVAVAAPSHDNGSIANAGLVRVFIYTERGNTWVPIGGDLLGDEDYSYFGSSVSMSHTGDRIAVGNPLYSDDVYGWTGQVKVYELQGGSWQPLGSRILGEEYGDEFGKSVALSSEGTVVAVGAVRSNADLNGIVRVYKLVEGDWAKLGDDLLVGGEEEEDRFGQSVSLASDGLTVAVGAYRSGVSGIAQVHSYKNNSWVQLGQDLNGTEAGDQFGYSVALSSSGHSVAVGAPENDGGTFRRGQVRVFRYNTIGDVWEQIGEPINGELASDQSGWSTSLSADGHIVAIGSRYNDGENSDGSGHARVFRFNGLSWQQIGQDLDGESQSDWFGEALSLSADGRRVAVGGGGGGAFGGGYAKVYELRLE